MPRILLLLICILVPLTASGQDGASTPQAPAAPAPATDSASLEEFARQLAADVSAGSPGRFPEVFDSERFARRVVAGIEVSAEKLDEASRGLIQGMHQSPGLFLSSFLGQSYEFLRVHPWNARPTLLFRLRPPSGGFAYHAFLFDGGSSGGLSIYDLYIYSSGELMSETLRRFLLPGLVAQDRSLLDRLLGRERSFVENMNLVREMGERIQAQEPAEALRVHARMPEDLRRDKTIRLAEMNALVAIEGSEERYLKAIEQYRDAFPNDPSMSMIVLDYHAMNGEYEVSMGLIDEIEGWVGGDPYLDVMRISTAYLAGRPTEALKRADDYLTLYPDDEEACWLRVSAALAAKDFDAVCRGLEHLEERFDYLFTADSLAAAAEYSEFLQSRQAQEYLAAREPEGGG